MAKIHYMCECCGEREADGQFTEHAALDERTRDLVGARYSMACLRQHGELVRNGLRDRILERRVTMNAQWAHRCQSMTRHPTEGMLLNCELQSHDGHHANHRHGDFNWSHEGECGERHDSGRLCTLNGLHAGPHLSLSKEGEIGSPAWEEPLPVWLSHVVSKFTGESAQIVPSNDGGFTISIADRRVGIRAELLERRDPQRVFWHLRAWGFRRAERGGDAPGPSLAEWFVRTAVELLNGARAAMLAADVEMRAKTDRHARSLAARQRETERALRLDAWANRQVPPPRQTSPARGAVAPGHPPSWPSQEGEER